MSDRKADRHVPGRQVPVGIRLDPQDFEPFEARRNSLGLSRRKALIQAIRDWVAGEKSTATGTPGEP